MALIDRIKLENTSDPSIFMRRYNVRDEDGTYLGWVVTFDGHREWKGFVTAEVNDYTRGVASQMARGYATCKLGRTRREALEEIASWLEIYALYGSRNR